MVLPCCRGSLRSGHGAQGQFMVWILLKNPLLGWNSTSSTSLTGMPNAAHEWPTSALNPGRESFRKEEPDSDRKVGVFQPNRFGHFGGIRAGLPDRIERVSWRR